MSLKGRLSLAWVFAIAALMMSGVDDGWATLGLVAGGLMIWAALGILRDPAAWDRLRHAQRVGPLILPGGRIPRLLVGGLAMVVGAGWTLGGVLGVLAIFGLYEFSDA